MDEPVTMPAIGAGRTLSGVRGVILDLDGVLYCGSEPMPGASGFVEFLAASGLRFVCLTNNAERSAAQISHRLASMGIGVPEDRIITSGWAMGAYLRSRAAAPRVHILGSPALRDVVLSAGAVEAAEADFVVVGIHSDIRVADLTVAARRIRAGARFLATNLDATRPSPHGPEPECGAMVAFLEAASGREATALGKPDHRMFEAALGRLALPAEEVVMIGDTVETDIVGAVAAGLRSILLGPPPSPALPLVLRPTLCVATLGEVQHALGGILPVAAAGRPGTAAGQRP